MKLRTNRINCLDRALDVLEEFARAEELGVSELARKLNTHVATIFNIVKTLALRRYLINVDGRYRLGPAAEQLAAAMHAALPLPQLLDPIVGELSRATGENAFAAILHGDQAKLLVSHHGSRDVTANSFRADWPSPLDLATGRVLVAFGPESLWKRFVDEWQRRKTLRNAAAPMALNAWRTEFQAIRARGMAEILNKDRESVSALAAPVFAASGRIAAAIGVSFPSLRLTRKYADSLRNEIRLAAASATQICGGNMAGAGAAPEKQFGHSGKGSARGPAAEEKGKAMR